MTTAHVKASSTWTVVPSVFSTTRRPPLAPEMRSASAHAPHNESTRRGELDARASERHPMSFTTASGMSSATRTIGIPVWVLLYISAMQRGRSSKP